jgi:hypothetical protein
MKSSISRSAALAHSNRQDDGSLSCQTVNVTAMKSTFMSQSGVSIRAGGSSSA